MKFKWFVFALLICGLAGNTSGQVLNGDFSNQGDYWDQKRANFFDNGFVDCRNSLSPDPWQSGDLRWRGGSNDWAVDLHDGNNFGSDPMRVCGSIEQTVTVPPGKRLVFEYKLGRTEFNNPFNSFRSVSFRLDIESPSGVNTVFSDSGRSGKQPCTFGCPVWEDASVDFSDFWGQVVTLNFSASSSYRRNPTAGGGGAFASPALLDNIRFEEIPANRFASPKAGSWNNPDRNGNGINISRAPTGELQLFWITYLPSGTPIWFISALEPMSQGQWNAVLDKATRDPVSGAILRQPVGSAEIRMLNNSELIFEWNLTAASGSPSQGGEKMVHLIGGDNYTGLWTEPAFSGWGFTLDVRGVGSSATSVATILFYTPAGQPTWGQGVGSGDLGQSVNFDVNTFTGVGLCPGCAGQSQSLQVFPAGTFGLQNMATQPAGFSAIQTTGGISWIRGSAGSPVLLNRSTTQ